MARDKARTPTPVVTVYRQRDHVRGILQQAYSLGLLTGYTKSTGRRE